MSVGASDVGFMQALDTHLPTTNAAGRRVTYVASAGDSGYGPSWPALSPAAIGVGGTSLSPLAYGYPSFPASHLTCAPPAPPGVNRANETVWGSAGGGQGTGGGYVSGYPKPAYQAGYGPGGVRSMPDVAMLADPASGVATVENGSWYSYLSGGTSLSAPMWGGVVALLNQGRQASGRAALSSPAWIYGASVSDYNDIVAGASAPSGNTACLIAAACTAGPSYDQVTGRGSPLFDALASEQAGGAPAPTPTPVPTPVPTPAPLPPSAAGTYHPVTPTRIFDSRSGSAALAPGTVQPVYVAPSTLVPASATAVVLNVGVTNTHGGASGYVQLLPHGGSAGTASTVNYLAGQTIANLTQVGLGSGYVDVYNAGAWADVFLDIQGYYGPSSAAGTGLYNSLSSPVRFLDTRCGPGAPATHCGALGPGAVLALQVAGLNGVPADAQAVVFNLTEVGGTAPSYLAAWPQGQSWPGNSNLNFPAGRVLANRAIVTVGSGGAIDIANSQGTVDVLVDVVGWFSGGSGGDNLGRQFVASSPSRIFDTRTGQGGHSGPLGPGELVNVVVPSGTIGAVSVNVTVLNASTNSFLSAFPAPPPSVTTSDVNFGPGDILPNLVVTAVASNGAGGYKFTIYNSVGSVDVFVDISGSYS
ncbi:MAG TPA: hypothetical protein VF134_01505 [Candidatus Dormibacteraeota bacterium]